LAAKRASWSMCMIIIAGGVPAATALLICV
jgi:hypothetical protein